MPTSIVDECVRFAPAMILRATRTELPRTSQNMRDDRATTRIGLILDCADPNELAAFWSAALGYTILGDAGAYTLLIPPGPDQSKLLLQRVPEAKSVKNRMHLDIEVGDVAAEVARLETLGAKRADDGARSEFGSTWQIMADPEGNEFCVCDAAWAGSSQTP